MLQSWNSIKRLGLVVALSVIFFQLSMLLAGAQGAQNITGLSKIEFPYNNTSIYLNSSLAIPFNVVLSSGSPGVTYLVIANGNALASNGIYVGLNPSTASPTFSSVLYINTNVKPGVVPGVYNLVIESGGADPIYPGTYNFTLTVLNTIAPPTTQTTSAGPTTSYSVTASPTTVASKSGSFGILGLGTTAIIIILVIIIIAFLAIRAKR
jgi:hypothetical protein